MYYILYLLILIRLLVPGLGDSVCVNKEKEDCLRECGCAWCVANKTMYITACVSDEGAELCPFWYGKPEFANDTDYCKQIDLDILLGVTLSIAALLIIGSAVALITFFRIRVLRRRETSSNT